MRPPKSKPIFLSLVIPLYNEEKRVIKGLTECLEYLKRQRYTWEVVLVNDGSRDHTSQLIKAYLKKEQRIKVVTHQTNVGKGAAVRDGMLVARGEYIFFSDIDFSAPIRQIPKLLNSLKTNDVAIGVRRNEASQVITHQPLLREFLGDIFTKLANFLVTPGIVDTTCGFKGFQNITAKKIVRAQKLHGWAFDAEVLFLARKFGFRIAQVPVVWADNSATKVHMFQDGVKAFIDLLCIRWRDFKGEYNIT